MEDLDGSPLRGSSPGGKRSKFSKWETSEAKSTPVVATSKWDHPEGSDEPARKKAHRADDEDIFSDDAPRHFRSDDSRSEDEDLDGTPLDDSSQEATRSSDSRSENRREKLREIELKVVRYQDEIEAGIQSRIPGMTLAQQIQQYRDDLTRKVISGLWVLSNFGTRGPVLERDFSHATRLEHWNPSKRIFFVTPAHIFKLNKFGSRLALELMC